jgi:hypothetical protein
MAGMLNGAGCYVFVTSRQNPSLPKVAAICVQFNQLGREGRNQHREAPACDRPIPDSALGHCSADFGLRYIKCPCRNGVGPLATSSRVSSRKRYISYLDRSNR